MHFFTLVVAAFMAATPALARAAPQFDNAGGFTDSIDASGGGGATGYTEVSFDSGLDAESCV